MNQADANICTIGHVDHGKTSLVQALTGKWTDTHSEELKRGITIKLGYADVIIFKCSKCSKFSTSAKCSCGGQGIEQRKISLLDAPGHETLMATVIAASSITDGAIFVIAANEKCPQPQTQEHLMVLEAAGITKVVIAQNKVDLVTREKAVEHYKQIKEFLKGTTLENAPVIPTSANVGGNISALLEAIEEKIPTPAKNLEASPKFFVARSFDINKPGTEFNKLRGGVLGGSVVDGKFTKGMEIAILPGALQQNAKGKESYEPLTTKITALHAFGQEVAEAHAGGLIAIGTSLDPALTKGDSLVGCVVGEKNTMPPVHTELKIEAKPLARVLESFNTGFQPNEPLVIGVGTNTTVGFVMPGKQKKGVIQLLLKKPVCAQAGTRVAIMRRANNRWRLYATGKIA